MIALFNQQRYPEARTLALSMTKNFPRDRMGWMMLGMSLMQTGKNAEALEPMQKAAALSPGDADAHNILGIVLYDLGRLAEAEASYLRALQIKPDYEVAHYNLGNTLKDLGRLAEAEASYRRALQIRPDYAVAHNNLGLTIQKTGRQEEAEASYRRALQIKPDFAGAHNNLGNVLKDAGRLDDAEACFRRALEVNPDYVDALNNLALLLDAQGSPAMALEVISHSLQIKETEEAKNLFVACAKYLRLTNCNDDNRAMMTRALTELWGLPSELAGVCASIVKLDPYIGACVARAVAARPLRLSAQDLFAGEPAALAGDALLTALLNSTPIYDIEMERFLTMARHAMLEAATATPTSDERADPALNFYCALANQSFINEYVFARTDEEIRRADELRNLLVAALETGARVPALWLAAVAAYFPLHTLPLADRLLDFEWPDTVAAVLTQQIREPEEELQLRTGIPRLTAIENETSLLVQGQYEENPFPRWIKTKPVRRLPPASLERQRETGDIDILIAGCGTGLHSIGTAQQFAKARVLAIDLSLSSLGYAKRKTRELGLTSIEYAQADLLKLGSLDRSFDVIESVGVLHHLADPWEGWRILLSLLRPGGFMKLGFYSEVARRNVVKVRNFIAGRGYGSTAEDIRRCRQDLLDADDGTNFGETLKSIDFFSTSACRDLLFHVHEHYVTLAEIDDFLKKNRLIFAGFEMDAHVLQAYKHRFPDDPTATDLGRWQVFENDNPDTFLGMYQFWIQKEGCPDNSA